MKTNQVLVRKMGEFGVLQRTSDGMFNATSLLRQWNDLSGTKKEIGDYFDNKSTKEFISTIISKENLHKGNSPYVKSRASRGDNKGTWMHPILFIDFAMWINPVFKYDVLKFVHDSLIKYRDDAGEAYKRLSSSIESICGKDLMKSVMPRVSKMLNIVVFGEHEKMIRNSRANEDDMRFLFDLEGELANLIEFGYIKDFSGVREYLLKRWYKRWKPNALGE